MEKETIKRHNSRGKSKKIQGEIFDIQGEKKKMREGSYEPRRIEKREKEEKEDLR